jgi:hypothetical protein
MRRPQGSAIGPVAPILAETRGITLTHTIERRFLSE